MAEGRFAEIQVLPVQAKVNVKLPVARDLCKTIQKYAYPVELKCSLACTPIRWPMQNGTLILQFSKSNPNCPQFGNIPSDYFAKDYPEGVAVGLGCNQNKDDGIWQSQDIIYGVFSNNPLLGITFRITSLMTVNQDASLSVNVTMERLIPASETGNPDGLNTFSSCVSFSANLTRDFQGNNQDPFDRQTYWVMNHLDPIEIQPSPQCPFDAQSVRMTVLLLPYSVGCDGQAEGHPEKTNCSLSTKNKTYSCISALVKPSIHGTFKPRWVQLGVNPNLSSMNGGFGCFNGVNAGPLLEPPVIADLKPDIPYFSPIDNYNFDYDLLNCGCPGENNQTSDKQQIQVGITEDEFNTDNMYQVLVKSVNNGQPCLAIRERNAGSWVIGQYSVNQEILNETGHWVAVASFPSVAGQPIVVLYALEFPSGLIANCVDNQNQQNGKQNVVFQMKQQASNEENKSVSKATSAKALAEKMKKVRESPCIYLGKALETEPTCGCGGSPDDKKFRILHECSIHGKCRISIAANAMACWQCPDYIDRKL